MALAELQFIDRAEAAQLPVRPGGSLEKRRRFWRTPNDPPGASSQRPRRIERRVNFDLDPSSAANCGGSGGCI